MERNIKERKYFMILIALILSAFVILNVTTIGATQASGAKFFVEAIIPENQINRENSFFDLKMKPSQKQTLEVKVINRSNEQIEITAEAITASTNDNGTVEYTIPGIKDEEMPIAFSEIAKVLTPNIKLAANEETIVQIEIIMPEAEYDGIVLGGLSFTEVLNEDDLNYENTIINQFNYVIGVKLIETDKEVEANFEFVSAESNLINSIPAIRVNLRNTESQLIKDLTAEMKIYKDQEKTKLIYKYKIDRVGVAPNSIFPFTYYQTKQELPVGNYIGEVTLSSVDKNWNFDFDFKVEDTSYNNSDGNEDFFGSFYEDEKSKYYVLEALALLAIIIVLVIMYQRRKNNN